MTHLALQSTRDFLHVAGINKTYYLYPSYYQNTIYVQAIPPHYLRETTLSTLPLHASLVILVNIIVTIIPIPASPQIYY